MRFQNVPIISFTDATKKTRAIRDRRAMPDFVTLFELVLKDGDEADEICTRREIYGEGRESESYKIVEANKAQMVDYRFDFSRMRKLQIPQ